MKVLVCGSREYDNVEKIEQTIKRIHQDHKIDLLIHGYCRGADKLASAYAILLGIPTRAYPADWAKHGKAAGPIRNTLMLEENPDLVIAFPKNMVLTGGTKNMVEQALKKGVDVLVVGL